MVDKHLLNKPTDHELGILKVAPSMPNELHLVNIIMYKNHTIELQKIVKTFHVLSKFIILWLHS